MTLWRLLHTPTVFRTDISLLHLLDEVVRMEGTTFE